ncbi:hypothetical protein [Halomonas salinarum]|uniref:hypothetical protein n=1 Tax=Halomonas salinarum TaxID=1158993 RepID=UPI0014393D1D|nr:hypothetical protein [Halomonas salinarum]
MHTLRARLTSARAAQYTLSSQESRHLGRLSTGQQRLDQIGSPCIGRALTVPHRAVRPGGFLGQVGEFGLTKDWPLLGQIAKVRSEASALLYVLMRISLLDEYRRHPL